MPRKKKKPTAIGSVGHGAKSTIDGSKPYIVSVTIEGTCPILFHRWDCDEVEAKSKAKKGSKAKKTDNLETYVYRNEKGYLCLPGKYLRGSIVEAAKFHQDPRSKRRQASGLFKAGVIPLTGDTDASLSVKDWDYEDRQRVVIQRAAITRIRPALHKGWRATIDLQVQTPEHIDPQFLYEVIEQAGRLVGVGDHRPTFGRFQIMKFDVTN